MKRTQSLFYIQRLTWVFFSALACCFLSGCLTTKSITYFQPLSAEMDEALTKKEALYEPMIKSGDILSITVNGLDKDDREMFNPIPVAYVPQYNQIGGFVVLQPIKGFSVDSAGFILFPQLGKLRVAGLTTKELEVKLFNELEPIIKSPTVTVSIANYIISILGEVARPAQYVISNNQITFPEALSLAGDLTIYGNRTNVLLIREMEGRRRFARIDLTDRSLFTSPYFYLRSGDVIYVEPTKGKLTSTDRTFQLAPVAISSLSLLLLVINILMQK